MEITLSWVRKEFMHFTGGQSKIALVVQPFFTAYLNKMETREVSTYILKKNQSKYFSSIISTMLSNPIMKMMITYVKDSWKRPRFRDTHKIYIEWNSTSST